MSDGIDEFTSRRAHVLAYKCANTFRHVVFFLSLKKCILKVEIGKALCVCKRKKKLSFVLLGIFYFESQSRSTKRLQLVHSNLKTLPLSQSCPVDNY